MKLKLSCSKCFRDKPLSEFNKALDTKRRYQRWCRKCSRAYERQWRQNNRPLLRANAKKARDKVSEYIRKLKTSSPCTDCGVSYPYYVMDFDHLGDKKFSIAHRGNKGINRLNTEIAKCELVCANCHRVRTWKRKYGK